MKKALLLPLIAIAATAVSQAELPTCETAAQVASVAVPDSVNIPVFLVDGIEVLDTDSLPHPDDIESIKVIKDQAVIDIFRPRLGGVVLITTKSKRLLKSKLEKAAAADRQRRLDRMPGELLIR